MLRGNIYTLKVAEMLAGVPAVRSPADALRQGQLGAVIDFVDLVTRSPLDKLQGHPLTSYKVTP